MKKNNHYDQHPFEFLSKEDELNIDRYQPKLFKEFLKKYSNKKLTIAEIGCGPGRGTLYMTKNKLNVTAVDLSEVSLNLAKRRAPNANFVNADNMNLPFKDKIFDIVISDGVIHHTRNPFQSLSENIRILKLGGKMYLTFYRKYSLYYYIYKFTKLVRIFERTKLGNFLINLLLVPPYYILQRIRSKNNISYQGSKNFFYDYLITPIAKFYTQKEMILFCNKNNMQLIEKFKYKNTFIFFLSKK